MQAFAMFLLFLSAAAEPKLSIEVPGSKHVFTRAELLKRSDIETVTVAADPAYGGKAMTYKAVKVAKLFEGLAVPQDVVVQFRCLDGFSAPISKDRLLNSNANQSVAYIAIETTEAPWPALKSGGPSAGPFYVVWQNPERSAVTQEEWPYQLAAFEAKGSLQTLYPKVFPAAGSGADTPVGRGFATFTRNCFPCHTMNRSGASEVGPDLNLPMNPTEYLTPAALRSLVRDPQSVRHFPKSRMARFPPEVLPDQELTDLVAYLEHMAKHKVP